MTTQASGDAPGRLQDPGETMGETLHALHYPDIEQQVYWSPADDRRPELFILLKPGFQRKYVTFATRYGSNDVRFLPRGASAPVETPAGIAHFLEHQLFDQPEGNALQTLGALGASPNAYTGHYFTVYLASAVEALDDVFSELLRFVQTPSFTEAGVRKEQGIIAQEIGTYEDHPGARLREDLLRCLYVAHPIRDRILGTVESIGRITADLLMLCHQTFYHPRNMTVTVVGDVDPERIQAMVAEQFAGEPRAGGLARRLYPDEPHGVNAERHRREMAITRPLVGVGVKLAPLVDPDAVPLLPGGAEAVLRTLLELEAALDAGFGQASPRYRQWYDEGLVTDRFYFGIEVQPGAAFLQIAGQSDRPDALLAAIEEALQAPQPPFSPDAFERSRRVALGDFLATLDSPDALVASLISDRYLGLDYFHRLDHLQALDVEAAQATWRRTVQGRPLACAVVAPEAGDDA